MNVSRNLIRTITTTTKAAGAAKGNIAPGYRELHKIQEKFQVKDGKPIFIKKGSTDQALYRITMGLSVVGIAGILKLLYELSWPKIE